MSNAFMITPTRILIVTCVALVTGGSSVLAQQRPMTVVDLLDVPGLADPQLSPDGRFLLYTRSDANWDANRRRSHIWRVGTDGSGAVQITNGEEGERSPRWSPDGSSIAFLAARGEDSPTQIFLIPNDGGEARPVTSHETAVSSIAWSPDGRHLYFIASDPLTPEEKRRRELRNDVYAFDEDYVQEHLWRVRRFDGHVERITEGDFSVFQYALSADGAQAAVHRGPNPLRDGRDESEVWVLDLDEPGAMVRITTNRATEGNGRLSPDGRTVLFTSDTNDAFEHYYNDKIFLAPADGSGPARRLLGNEPFEVQSAEWSADGESIYFVANFGAHSQLMRYDLASESTEALTDGDHSIRGWTYQASALAFVYGIDTRLNAGDFWLHPLGASPTRVTTVFDYLAETFLIPEQERISWSGADGITVEGLLFYPLEFREGERYPLVVQTHGGPASSDRHGFQGSAGDYIHKLTAMGYMVLLPNYRGSTGYGDEFLRDMVGHYFRNAHLDVLAGVDYLIDRGLVDGNRMAKMGWSAGGHMTNKIITFTDRFKAASSGAGAANWISMYAQSDTRYYRTPWFGGTPWEPDAPTDVYWEHSPLRDVAKVTTPTLVLVGEDDPRVPMPQSVELYRALRSNRVPTHLYVAPREPHGWQELRHRLFKANVELDWFERWVRDREYEWESAPGDQDADTDPSG